MNDETGMTHKGISDGEEVLSAGGWGKIKRKPALCEGVNKVGAHSVPFEPSTCTE